MCSQRSTVCTRNRSGRLRRTRRPATGCSAVTALLATAELDTRPPDLLVARQVGGDGRRGERQLVLHELVAAMLARRLDDDAVGALLHHVAAVVAAVPRDGVLARQPSGARHSCHEVGAARGLLVAF